MIKYLIQSAIQDAPKRHWIYVVAFPMYHSIPWRCPVDQAKRMYLNSAPLRIITAHPDPAYRLSFPDFPDNLQSTQSSGS
jgi:hypothetical protein